ncbi:Acyl-CoA dehydrogenase [compost metagenome]
MGQRSAHVAQIQLEDCRVPVANLLGAEGSGYRNVMGSLSEGRVAIAAVATGTARAALEAAVAYAKEREAYGAPIINLQGVAFDLADMATQVAVAEQFMVHVARLCEADVPCAREASMAKLFASEMAEKVCSDALQIHGGYGYLNDFPVERYCRDVRVTKIYEGTSHIQKLIIARSLL